MLVASLLGETPGGAPLFTPKGDLSAHGLKKLLQEADKIVSGG
jgi:hypothetical protein